MSGLEFNKIFAAVLVAGITASFSGFVSYKLVHPHKLHEDAVPVEGMEGGAGGGPAKPKMPDPILNLIAGADIAKGEKLSKACAVCHSFEKGGPNGTGPNLWNMVDQAAASKSGFAYSDAMAEMDRRWTYTSLNHFLWKPKNYVPGTKMNYIGLRKAQDRADMIAWLRTLADSPAALPSQADINQELEDLGLDEEGNPIEELLEDLEPAEDIEHNN